MQQEDMILDVPATETEVEVDEATDLFGAKEVRWYQRAASNAVGAALLRGKRRVLIVQPTGSGKTLTIAITLSCPQVRKALNIPEDRQLRVLVCAHLQRLLTQAQRTFADASNVEVRTQSVHSNISAETLEWADLVVLDEAHHEAMVTIQYHLENMGGKPIIGLTATNERPDSLLLKFDEEIELLSREQAVEQGYLAETSVWTIINSETVCGRQKDADTVNIMTKVISKYHLMMGQSMIFVRTRSEIERLTANLVALGINAVGLTNQTAKQLEAVLTSYEQGEIQFLINCKKIGEGVDCPDTTTVGLGCTIGSIIDLNQRIGRAARPSTECYVFELINPLNPKTLSAVDVVGTPKNHTLVYEDALTGELIEEPFMQ